MAGGETLQITATPAAGYMFSGWNSLNGGSFADANSPTTVFTMPGNATTVTAFFSFIGLPGGFTGNNVGGVILPTPVHYFTNTSVYIRNSGVAFGHVTIRDFQLFSHVSLNGRALTRNAHFTATRLSGSTEIILTNGYLDGLNQGQHTLTVHFTDHVSVSTVFTVIVAAQQLSLMHSDVFPSDWFSASVDFVTQRGLMTGSSTDPGLFRPHDLVTQGEVIDALPSGQGRRAGVGALKRYPADRRAL
jgi:hypothetical protein